MKRLRQIGSPRRNSHPPEGFIGLLPGIGPVSREPGSPSPLAGPPAPPPGSHFDPPLARAEYRPWFVQNLLNENPNKSLPFFWTINPYRGCEFGCGYCFARYTHHFLDLRRAGDFERRIFVKLGAGQVLRETLRPGMLRGRPVALGTATDPYQPAESHFGITRAILEVLADCPDLELSITTKSPLILRDLDLLRAISRRRPLTVNITLTTLDRSLARILEGRSPSPRRRLEALRSLSSAGIHTSVFVMPILPGITDDPGDLERLLSAARQAGAEEAHGGLLHLEAPTRAIVFAIVRRRFPHLWEEYQRTYAQGRLAPAEVRRREREKFALLRVRAGFPRRPPPRVYEPMTGEQLSLAALAASDRGPHLSDCPSRPAGA